MFAVTFLVIVVIAFYLDNVNGFWKACTSARTVIVSCTILIVAALSFYDSWRSNGSLASVASRLGLTGTFLAGALAVFGAIVGFYFCNLIVAYIVDAGEKTLCSDEIEIRCFPSIQQKAFPCLIALGLIIFIVCSISVSIWEDEAFTLRIIQYSYLELIQYTAADVHPPLYYLLLKSVEDVCALISTNISFAIIIAKLFSVVSYVLTALLCWKKIKDSESKTIAWMAILCLIAAPKLIEYGIEIRMYGWAVFFVTGAFLYAKDIMENRGTIRHWILLVVFSLCSAYTHNFALIAMAAVWLYLLIWIIKIRAMQYKKWFGFGIVTALGYLPWFIVLINQVQAVANDYWISDIDIPTVSSYITFVIPGCLVFVLVAAVFTAHSQIKTTENTWSGVVGILIPVTTLVIGLAISLILRPILTSKYLIPGVLCLWIGVLLIWQKMSKGNKMIVVSILAISFVASCLGLIVSEYSLGVKANISLALIKSMAEDSVIYVEEGSYYVISSYTDKTVFYVGENGENDVFAAIFSNVHQADDDTETFISELLDKGTTVYYFTTGDIENEWSNGTCTLLGTYNFSTDSTVYQITPLIDSD